MNIKICVGQASSTIALKSTLQRTPSPIKARITTQEKVSMANPYARLTAPSEGRTSSNLSTKSLSTNASHLSGPYSTKINPADLKHKSVNRNPPSSSSNSSDFSKIGENTDSCKITTTLKQQSRRREMSKSSVLPIHISIDKSPMPVTPVACKVESARHLKLPLLC